MPHHMIIIFDNNTSMSRRKCYLQEYFFCYLHRAFENSIYSFATIKEIASTLGLNEIYVWFLLPTYPNFFNRTLNIKMVFQEKIPKMGTFSDCVTIFFVKCYNKI